MNGTLLDNLILLGAADGLIQQYQNDWSNPRSADNLLHYLLSQITTPRELKKVLPSCAIFQRIFAETGLFLAYS